MANLGSFFHIASGKGVYLHFSVSSVHQSFGHVSRDLALSHVNRLQLVFSKCSHQSCMQRLGTTFKVTTTKYYCGDVCVC